MRSSVYFVIAIIVVLFFCDALATKPCTAAQKGKNTQASSWPLWYRYDQEGLKEWNLRKKDNAEVLFTRALNMADATLGGRKNLDPITKKRLKEVFNHNMFLISHYKQPQESQLRNLDHKAKMARTLDYKIDQTNEKEKMVSRLKRLHIKYFGQEGKESYVYDRAITKLRVWNIKDKQLAETYKGWPIRSYDNGGRFSKDQFYHINKDGTTTSLDKPSENALNRNNPNFNENEWVKKNNPGEKKTGSHYRGLRATQGHHVPEWYRSSNSNSPKRVDRSEKNRYKGAKWYNTHKGSQGYDPSGGTTTKAWGDTRRQQSKDAKPTVWGSPRQIPKNAQNSQAKQSRPWGQSPPTKSNTPTVTVGNKKITLPKQEVPRQFQNNTVNGED